MPLHQLDFKIQNQIEDSQKFQSQIQKQMIRRKQLTQCSQLNFQNQLKTWIRSQFYESHPCERKGHCCAIVDEKLYLFGGLTDSSQLEYKDSSYMNDLWVYYCGNWENFKTKGDIPRKRANATLNYDSENNQLILFAGGAGSQTLFNSVYTLNLKTLEWCLIKCINTPPSKREYHSAQLQFPYLLIYGGKNDLVLGDLWVLDLKKCIWQKIILQSKPRYLHASCLIKNTLYISGGCEDQKQKFVLNDLYAIDLSPLLNKQPFKSLAWKQIKMNGPKLQRWGHTSYSYNGFIYVFGGRSKQMNLNDLLKIDPLTGNVIRVQTTQRPQARNRHSGGMIKNRMLIFGGYNGTFLSDLNQINLGIDQLTIFCNGIRNHIDRKNRQIILNKQKIIVNQKILCSNSEQFERLFSSREGPIILNIDRCTPLHIELIQVFLVEKILILPHLSAVKFCIQLAFLAKYFKLYKLLEACEDQLLQRLNTDSLVHLVQVAKRLNMQTLKKKCKNFVNGQIQRPNKYLISVQQNKENQNPNIGFFQHQRQMKMRK